MITIILGSNHDSTTRYSLKLGLEASTLVQSVDQVFLVGHTSVQYIPNLDKLEMVLKRANTVYWSHPDKNEFHDDNSYYDFLYWLQEYNYQYKNVRNLNDIKLDPYNWKFNAPKLTPDDIVFLGGSTTAGVGLSDPNTRYTTKLANYFKKQSVNLAQSYGTIRNNDKTFDIFSQCDFVPGQIVVIHVTPIDRVRWCDDDAKLQDLQLSNNQLHNHREMILVFNRKYLVYRLLNNIRSMIKIARLQKIKLVLWLDNYKLDAEFDQDQLCFYEYPEIISKVQLANYYVDHAEDKVHPGIQSNQILADRIIQHIERLYE